MFKRRTLFVVGAGASAELGLPLGLDLADKIAVMLSVRRDFDGGQVTYTDRELLKQLQRADPGNSAQYPPAFRLVSQGVRLSNSIDDFLDIHQQNAYANRAGKAAIVKSILAAERASKLFFSQTNIYNQLDMARVEGTWLIKFVRMLGRNVRLEEIEGVFKNISLIVFNYDRCIEHFLLQALQQLYSIPEERAAKILSTLNIIHPYGDVGDLITSKNRYGIHFGGDVHDPNNDNFVELAKRIRTYTEVKEDEAKGNIDIALQDSETWVFLGFAFHEQNLRLLMPGTGHSPKTIFATAYGMSDSDVGVTRGRLLQMFFKENSRIAMKVTLDRSMHSDLTCTQLFDYYTQSLPA
jgi:hypothetical protein